MSGLLSGIGRMFGQRGRVEESVSQGGGIPDPLRVWKGPCEANLVEGLMRLHLPRGFRLERLLVNSYRILGPRGVEGRLWFESVEPAEAGAKSIVVRDVPPAILMAFDRMLSGPEGLSLGTVTVNGDHRRLAFRRRSAPAIGRDRLGMIVVPHAGFDAVERLIDAFETATFAPTLTPLDRIALTPGWHRVCAFNTAWMRTPIGWDLVENPGRVTYLTPFEDDDVPTAMLEYAPDCRDTRRMREPLDPARYLEAMADGYRQMAAEANPPATAIGPLLRFDSHEVLKGLPVRRRHATRAAACPGFFSEHRFVYTAVTQPGGSSGGDGDMYRRMADEIEAAIIFARPFPGDPETVWEPIRPA